MLTRCEPSVAPRTVIFFPKNETLPPFHHDCHWLVLGVIQYFKAPPIPFGSGGRKNRKHTSEGIRVAPCTPEPSEPLGTHVLTRPPSERLGLTPGAKPSKKPRPGKVLQGSTPTFRSYKRGQGRTTCQAP